MLSITLATGVQTVTTGRLHYGGIINKTCLGLVLGRKAERRIGRIMFLPRNTTQAGGSASVALASYR
jgi:hypothetical protein